MELLELSLGPTLIGIILSVFLIGAIFIQSYNSLDVQVPRRNKSIKTMVFYLFIIDMYLVGAEFVIAFQYIISFYEDILKTLIAIYFFAPIPVVLTSVSAVAECFFAWHVAKFIGSKLLGLLIGVLALAQFCRCTPYYTYTYTHIQHIQYSYRHFCRSDTL
jgi:hypothetical protein